MRLEYWLVLTPIADGVSVVSPDFDARPLCLQGEVVGSPEYNDGRMITTSALVRATPEGAVITKTGSRYELGPVHTRYENNHPNARERLLANLNSRTP